MVAKPLCPLYKNIIKPLDRARYPELRYYIEVKPDFSDLEEKMDYYTAHPDEAQAIINHAHEYVEQFKDKQREDIISLMVLDKSFSLLKSKD